MSEDTEEHTGDPADALDVIETQNDTISRLFDEWGDATKQLEEADSVEVRWERGSAGKLLLQHVALRESAKQIVAGHLAEEGHAALAERLEGDGPARRRAIDRLDELTRGMEAINVNNPEIDGAVDEMGKLFVAEAKVEHEELLPAIRRALGPPGQRDLASVRYVRTHSPTHPSPVPRWYDWGPLKAVHAMYDHLRGTPHSGTKPDVDSPREHTPG